MVSHYQIVCSYRQMLNFVEIILSTAQQIANVIYISANGKCVTSMLLHLWDKIHSEHNQWWLVHLNNNDNMINTWPILKVNSCSRMYSAVLRNHCIYIMQNCESYHIHLDGINISDMPLLKLCTCIISLSLSDENAIWWTGLGNLLC